MSYSLIELEREFAMSKASFGNRAGRALAQMPESKRFAMICDGLPIIRASACGFWNAASVLAEQGRESTVLRGFAEEEAAKALILIDLLRCPRRRKSASVGKLMQVFYDHLGRLLYAEAQTWRASSLAELRRYVDQSRKSHYLEGYVGEYIVPNSSRYGRESALYADIEAYEDGTLRWNDPHKSASWVSAYPPAALRVVEAMYAIGMFEPRALKAIAEIWEPVEFQNEKRFEDNELLIRQLFERLDREQLLSEAATEEHARVLLCEWQMPMYDLDFRELAVPLEELEAERDANLWREAGYHPVYG